MYTFALHGRSIFFFFNLVVREASVVAVGKLALKSQKFSILALDFLADMFNDEIDAVRLRSIGCLKRICENIELKEEQIEIVLKALDEFSSDSRNAVRELLSVCRLSTISCLRLVVDSLLANLKRYSSDKKSIWNCLRHLGANHPGIVAVITPDLLEIHPFFETAEPDMDSPAYIGILILVINAAAICPAIKAIFLHHTWRHYEYLRHSLPELVPCLTAALRDQTNLDNKGSVLKQLSAMLEESKAKLVSIRHLTGEAKLVVLELLARDMQRIGEFASGTTMEGQAAFLLLFMRCQFALEKIHSKGQSVGTSSCNTHVDSQFQQIVDVFKLALQLEYLFNGASIEASQCVTDLKLRSAALLFVRRPDCFPIFSRSLQNALRTGSQLGSKLLEQNITEATVQSSSLCSILVASPYVLPFPVANVQLKREPEESVSVSSYQLERLKTEIIEPTPEAEQIYRFTAGLVAAINFVANFSGFNEALLKRIRIRVG